MWFWPKQPNLMPTKFFCYIRTIPTHDRGKVPKVIYITSLGNTNYQVLVLLIPGSRVVVLSTGIKILPEVRAHARLALSWIYTWAFQKGSCLKTTTVVSRIYAPRFATLALAKAWGGGLICRI